ncbi:metallo-dependent hydrolase [Anaerospora hongkongensis]|uniref:metallo-dependent hydrolase n=1 Tax=Anaerospora hongkongensis TaxID=244830 RepID=UPI00289E1750|nr:metallo-dependent hydrolase [Anaerospora hongkongensis]
MSIKGELLIRGGTVIDPARSFFGETDILITNGRVADTGIGQTVSAERTIDADGCLVLPGLIDYHTHVFQGGTEIGFYPDSALLPQGVTTAVDQGSAGITNFESFFKTIINTSQMRILAYLHVSPAGLATLTRCLEPVDPKLFDGERIGSLLKQFRSHIVGLKIRQSKEIVGDLGVAPLAATIRMADKIGCSVVVHTTNPPGEVEDMLTLLRAKDVYTHVFQGKGSSILTNSAKVRESVRQARERGIVFDTADGRGHYAFSVIKAALAQGFEPDVISTDLVRGSLFDRSVFGLPMIMSKYLTMGIPLYKVIESCTAAPARLLGMEGKLGTLQPGAYGDVSVFKLQDSNLLLEDSFGETIHCTQVFVPQMTVLGGKIVYRSLEL